MGDIQIFFYNQRNNFSKPFLKLQVMAKKGFVYALLQKMKLVFLEKLFL
ncbi:Uncharacterised protein [Streptococcus pneumoniae]|nr:Uncharacterised protein [Streptococcus pneumoniae]